jgi:hypothetical protein
MRLSTAIASAAAELGWLCACATLLTASASATATIHGLFFRGEIM